MLELRVALRLAAPLAIGIAIAMAPVPEGLAPHAWRYFAIFAGVVAGLVLEPLPNAAVGFIGVTLATLAAPWVLFSPAEMATAGFDADARAIDWALSGFRNPAVWLVFAAFMFGLGYEKSGLGRRVALALVRTMGGHALRLGYAVVIFDALLAPFTPSNTARSAGTVYPIVRQLPPIYDSRPDAASARRIGAYLMWTAFSASCVTSTLFLTALAPNLLAVEIIASTLGLRIDWLDWLLAAAPFGVPMLVLLPLLVYRLYPPELGASPAIPDWAAAQSKSLGATTRAQWAMAALAALALALWVLAPAYIHATSVAFAVIALMLCLRLVTWGDVIGNGQAWDALVRLATLVTLAEGLQRTGFVGWCARSLSAHLGGLDPTLAAVALLAAYFYSHYLFATTTAHTVAVMPVMLSVGQAVPGLPIEGFALMLALTHGVMGVISPYATGPSPVYHGSGYITNAAYWRLGATFGTLFLFALLALSGPLLLRGAS